MRSSSTEFSYGLIGQHLGDAPPYSLNLAVVRILRIIYAFRSLMSPIVMLTKVREGGVGGQQNSFRQVITALTAPSVSVSSVSGRKKRAPPQPPLLNQVN